MNYNENNWKLPLWWGGWGIGIGSCFCRHWFWLVIPLDVIGVKVVGTPDIIGVFVELDVFLATINSTCGSSRDSVIISATSWKLLPWRQWLFHSITSSPEIIIRKIKIYQVNFELMIYPYIYKYNCWMKMFILPGLNWPSRSAILPFLTFSMRAPVRPSSRSIPPTTLRPRILLLPVEPACLRRIMCPIVFWPGCWEIPKKSNWSTFFLLTRHIMVLYLIFFKYSPYYLKNLNQWMWLVIFIMIYRGTKINKAKRTYFYKTDNNAKSKMKWIFFYV